MKIETFKRTTQQSAKRYPWWQKGIIYQIYPLSWKDSDNDGRGDLRGIICKLEYLQWLGVSAIWLSPIYPYLGSMQDFEDLLAACHKCGIKLILDFVPNWRNTEVQKATFDVMRFWLDKGVDGFLTDQPDVHDNERILIGAVHSQLIIRPWRAVDIFAGINDYEASLPDFAWPNWVIGNHDKSRTVSRIGPEQARVAAILLLTLRGTPTIYYGDEIGMHDVAGKGRDPQCSPMQWDCGPNAGFSSSPPWLPVAGDFSEINVQTQRNQENSMLQFYRRLIQLRQQEPALQTGAYRPAGQRGNFFAFMRENDAQQFLIIVNLGRLHEGMMFPGHWQGEVVLGTNPNREGRKIHHAVDLDPNEGIIVKLKQETEYDI